MRFLVPIVICIAKRRESLHVKKRKWLQWKCELSAIFLRFYRPKRGVYLHSKKGEPRISSHSVKMDEREGETFWSEPKKRRNWTPKHNLWLLCGGGWRRGWALLFFCLIAPFGGQKLEILGRGEANIFFVALEANFVLFHFSSNPHKKIPELVMDFLYLLQTSWWFRTDIFHKTYHSSRHGRITGIPLLNSRRPQTCCYLVS